MLLHRRRQGFPNGAIFRRSSVDDNNDDIASEPQPPLPTQCAPYLFSCPITVPQAVTRTFGVGAAADIARTFRLEGEGYRVEWSTIPVEITPLNRVIVGIPPELRGAEAGGTVPLVRAAELRQRRQRQWKRGEDGAAESDGVVADALTELLLQLGSGGSSESSAEGVGGGGGDGQAAAAAEGAGGAGGSSSLASAANKILGGMERGRGAGGAAASSRRIVRHREEEEDVA